MHGNIYELFEKPVSKSEYSNEHILPAWFFTYCDYYDYSNSDRKEDLEQFYNCLKKEYKDFIENETVVFYFSDIENYFNNKLAEFVECRKTIDTINNLDEYAHSDKSMINLKNAYNNKHDCWIYINGKLETLDDFMKKLYIEMKESDIKEKTFHFGAIWDYHY